MFYFMSVHSRLILELHPVFPNYTLFIYLSFPSAVLQTPDHVTYSVGLWLFVAGFCHTDWSKTSTSPPKMTHVAECLASIVVGPLHRPPPTWDVSSPGVVGHSGRQWRAAHCHLGWWSRLPSSGRWAVRCMCSRGWGFQILGGAGRLLGKIQQTWAHTCLTLVQSEFYLLGVRGQGKECGRYFAVDDAENMCLHLSPSNKLSFIETGAGWVYGIGNCLAGAGGDDRWFVVEEIVNCNV